MFDRRNAVLVPRWQTYASAVCHGARRRDFRTKPYCEGWYILWSPFELIEYLRIPQTFVRKSLLIRSLPIYMTNSASRWRKIAKNLPQDLIHYTITITWYLTDSHTKVTSPRTARKKAAQNLKLHFIRIRHCDECICRWVWTVKDKSLSWT